MAMPQCCLSPLTEESSTQRPTPSPGQKLPQLQSLLHPLPFRNSQSYLQAIRDLNNLFFSRVRNAFYQNDLIYRLSPEGRWNHQACQLAHQYTGSPPSRGLLPHLHQAHVKGPDLDLSGRVQTPVCSSGVGTHAPAAGTGNPESGCQVLCRDLQESPSC